MNRRILFESDNLPLALRYTDIKSYLLTALMVALTVTVPWALHQFSLAGATYLPMQLMVLMGGLLFGWKAGLAMGVISPLISYSISGMPPASILPQTLVELSMYGLAAGLLREKAHFNVLWSLAGAMLAGRLALLIATSLVGLTGQVNSPLGIETGPAAAVWTATQQGWPGMVIQITCIPLVIFLVEKKWNLKGRQ